MPLNEKARDSKRKSLPHCPLVVQTCLSSLVGVGDGDPVRSVWNVVVRLILVDVLFRERNTLKSKWSTHWSCFSKHERGAAVTLIDASTWHRILSRAALHLVRTDTYSTQRERERLQDVQHGLQHAAAPQQMGEPGREEPTGRRVSRHQPSVTAGRSTSLKGHTDVSAKPERYLSATLRILLCVWLKLTSRNWACRSSSSSCSLVFGWNKNNRRQSEIATVKQSSQTPDFSSGFSWSRDVASPFLPSSAGKRQTPCRPRRWCTASFLPKSQDGPWGKSVQVAHVKWNEAGIQDAPDLSFWMALSSKYRNMTWNLSGSLDRSILGESREQSLHFSSHQWFKLRVVLPLYVML